VDSYQTSWNEDAMLAHACYRWHVEIGGHPNYAATAFAATNNHLQCLQQLVSLGAQWHGGLAEIAAENKHWECLAFILCEMCNSRDDIEQIIIAHKHRCDYRSKSVESTPIPLILPTLSEHQVEDDWDSNENRFVVDRYDLALHLRNS